MSQRDGVAKTVSRSGGLEVKEAAVTEAIKTPESLLSLCMERMSLMAGLSLGRRMAGLTSDGARGLSGELRISDLGEPNGLAFGDLISPTTQALLPSLIKKKKKDMKKVQKGFWRKKKLFQVLRMTE